MPWFCTFRHQTTQWLHVLIVLWSCLALLVSGCGIITHSYVAHRAFQFLSDLQQSPDEHESRLDTKFTFIVKNNWNAFVAGAPFPDWGYACPKTFCPDQDACHDASETAHWLPFQKAAAEYIRETYPDAKDPKYGRVVAWFLGISSHGIADLVWHGLGQRAPAWSPSGPRGYIQTLGGVEFDCHGSLCSQAHTLADTGAEFLIDLDYDTSFEPLSWDLPLSDIEAIYHRMGHTAITSRMIGECASILYAGAEAERLAGKTLFPHFAAQTPFQIDVLEVRWDVFVIILAICH